MVACVWGYGPRYSLNIHTSWGFLFGLGDISQGLLEKNILNFYRLEDADGTEITPEELADKYFSDPESCFITDFQDKDKL